MPGGTCGTGPSPNAAPEFGVWVARFVRAADVARRMLLRGNPRNPSACKHRIAELLRLTQAARDGPVMVPMTLMNCGCFHEIVGT